MLPVEGTTEEFPDCPAAYLRTAHEVNMLTDRWGIRPFAEHLIDGVTHPGTLVSSYAAELESGARSVDSLSPRALALVYLWNRESNRKREFERTRLRKGK